MESSDLAPQTGLEESMWEMGLGGESYPERPGKPDCIYYLRTGFCGYGSRCRFNHPPDRSAVPEERRTDEGEYPERAGQPVCQYYMRTGTCKFGSSCKYHHPRQGAGAVNPVVLNVYGYPLRPGEKECSYYMKRGQCKFGMTCKFHHPQPANLPLPAPTPVAVPAPTPVPTPAIYPPVQSPSAPPSQQYGVMAGNWTVARPPMVPGSYVQGPYGPMLYPPGVVPLPGWAPYPAPQSPVASSTAQTTAGAGQLYGFSSLSPSAPAYTGSFQPISSSIGSVGPPSSTPKEFTLPQRPDQPECQYYLKTGDCKFGLSCKYHHPLESAAAQTSSTLSPMGLPLRPGVPTCTYYAQHGVCKFGPTCRFDHPMGTLSYSPSASSLSDMPVAPYPVGSAIGTQAPSSSSSDLRAEVNKDSYTTASSTSTLNGSKLSKNGATGHESEARSSS